MADLVDKPYLNHMPVHQNAIFVDKFIWNSVRRQLYDLKMCIYRSYLPARRKAIFRRVEMRTIYAFELAATLKSTAEPSADRKIVDLQTNICKNRGTDENAHSNRPRLRKSQTIIPYPCIEKVHDRIVNHI